jgi:hypothetical protein
MEGLGLAVNHPGKDMNQPINLLIRPPPILRGKSVEGEVLNFIIVEAVDNTADIAGASLMPSKSG